MSNLQIVSTSIPLSERKIRCKGCKTTKSIENFMNKENKLINKTCDRCRQLKKEQRERKKLIMTSNKDDQYDEPCDEDEDDEDNDEEIENTKEEQNVKKENNNLFIGENYNYKSRFNKYKSDDPNFDIPLDEFVKMITDNCHYCGKRNLYKGFNGIDRVDSNQPHILENCVPCCWPCNKMKSVMNITDFKRSIKSIYEHLNLVEFN